MVEVLVRAELLDKGPDSDGNVRVMIPYVVGTDTKHGRVRFIDPAAIVEEAALNPTPQGGKP